MAKSVKDILALIKQQGIKMVDFKMVDINGQYRHVTIPAENFSEDTMKSGIGFDASNYGYAVVEKVCHLRSHRGQNRLPCYRPQPWRQLSRRSYLHRGRPQRKGLR